MEGFKFKNKPWTLEYKKACGSCWLALGIPCLVWGIICRVMEVSGWRAWVPFLLVLIPGIVYSFAVEKKYKKLLKENEQESGDQPVADVNRDE